MSRKFWMQFGLAFGLLFFASVAQAETKPTYIDTFTDGSNKFYVMTYFDPTKVPKKIALLGIQNGTRRNSITLFPDDWSTLFTLWTKAEAAQSNSWQDVGEINEKGDSADVTLKIRAGRGMTFLVSEPSAGILTFLLSTANIARFDAAVRRVKDSLADQTSE